MWTSEKKRNSREHQAFCLGSAWPLASWSSLAVALDMETDAQAGPCSPLEQGMDLPHQCSWEVIF